MQSRFELKRHLGEGGFGVVFQAYDRDKRAVVALKALHRIEAQSLLRFKREFRTLAGFSHRNLVQLYELIADGASWFMTMEYVEGENFLSGVADATTDSRELQTFSGQADTLEMKIPETGPLEPVRHQLQVDYEHLSDATSQLASGILELHDNGILHRDLKPSNVLIDTSGRVVILDFGMVQELRPSPETPTRKTGFAGTPHYIAPEQAMGKEAGRESDWYSVGVMLHEVLVGEYPIDGRSAIQILLKKQQDHVPDPDAFPGGAPHELVELCRDLLQIDPAARPDGSEIMERLGHGSFAPADQSHDSVFVGRVSELSELDHALRRVRSKGTPVVANIRAESGMGKSALVHEFIGRIDDEVLVLKGRCYESESVPFKAVDGVFDELVEQLESRESDGVPEHIDVESIGRLFPVVRKLTGDVGPPNLQMGDELSARRRAFEAMRDLFHEIASDRRVVVWIDDAQWGDRDSVALLGNLIRGGSPPPILWLVTARSEDRSESLFLGEWDEMLADAGDRVKVVEIGLDPLSDAEASELATSLLGEDDVASDAIRREAGGHPFFIDELARHRARRERVDSTITSLDDLIRYRFDALDDASKKLLEAISVAGQPIETEAVRDVARLGDKGPSSLARLRNERLIRVRSRDSGAVVETYHDRIRETVRDSLPVDRRRLVHRRIGEALLELSPDAYDRLRLHFREGGETERATRFAIKAGDKAASALAFDEAIEAYEEALSLGTWEPAETLELNRSIGDWNALLARGNAAADAYRAAARVADPEIRIELEQKAAEQLIRCGQLERGMAAMSNVMQQLGVTTPSSSMAIPAIIWKGIRFKMRGDDYELSQPATGLKRARLDAFWALANLMATIDVRLGAYYQLVNLHEALDSGDRAAILSALGLQAVHDATTPKHRARAEERFVEADQLLEGIEEDRRPFHGSWLSFARGLVAYMAGDFRSAVTHCRKAIRILEDNQFSMRWEVASIQSWEVQCLFFTGDFQEFRSLANEMIVEAEQARDFLHLIAVGLWAHYIDLADGDPDAATRRLDDAIAGWSERDYHLQDFWYLRGRVNVAIFRGDGASAIDMVREEWSSVRSAFILNSETGRVTASSLAMRAAIAAAVDGDVGAARREIRGAKRRLRKWKPDWGMALITLHEAELAAIQGDDAAVELLAEAEAACDRTGLVTYRDGARVLLGHLVGGERGEEMRQRPLDDWRDKGAKAPEAYLSVFVPSLRRYRRLLES